MEFRAKLARHLWLLPILLALTSTLVYFGQGGFGAGHGPFDQVLFALALPWCLLPIPGQFLGPDLVWLVAVPLLINSIAVALLSYWLRRSRQ